jgi:hypothetical protein
LPNRGKSVDGFFVVHRTWRRRALPQTYIRNDFLSGVFKIDQYAIGYFLYRQIFRQKGSASETGKPCCFLPNSSSRTYKSLVLPSACSNRRQDYAEKSQADANQKPSRRYMGGQNMFFGNGISALERFTD